MLCGVGGAAVVVGAKLNFVCRWSADSVLSAVVTLVCFVFILPRGEASLPSVLVGLRLFLLFASWSPS